MKKLLKDEGENMIDIVYTNNKEVIAMIWTSWLSFLAWLLGGFDFLIKALLIFMVFDFITGLMAGYKLNILNSKRGTDGIQKKFFVLIIISCTSLFSRLIGNDFLRNIICIFYCSIEILSVLENAAKCGIPIPPKLKKALEQCRESPEKEKNKGES